MSTETASTIAAWLQGEHDVRRPFEAVRGDARRTPGFAYDIQDRLVAERLRRANASVVGYKIGLTTRRMQEFCGIDEPMAGVILSGTIALSPAQIAAASFVRLGVESEIAVRLNRPLDTRGGRPARSEVALAVGDIAAAFELIEDRGADYRRQLDGFSLIADNGWNGGLILGEPVTPRDIDDVEGVLAIDGVATDSGRSSDVLGHPYDALAWLAEHLATRGGRLEPGQWVTTGSIVPTRYPKPGQIYEFAVADLPPVRLEVG